MNEIREWLVEHGYTLIGELIGVDGGWELQVQSDGGTLPIKLLAPEVEHPQRGISAIESLFNAIRH